MTDQVSTEVITPALSKDVKFTEKVQAVDEALKSRAAANKNIKTKWAGIVKVLVKYSQSVPSRRVDAAVASNYVPNLVVYKAPDKKLDDQQRVRAAQDAAYDIRDLVKHRRFMQLAEAKFTGFQQFTNELLDLNELANNPQEEDEVATKAARKEMQAAVDAYVAAIEAYDETVESVANVKEYISVVKDVAEISAIAQGQQQKTN